MTALQGKKCIDKRRRKHRNRKGERKNRRRGAGEALVGGRRLENMALAFCKAENMRQQAGNESEWFFLFLFLILTLSFEMVCACCFELPFVIYIRIKCSAICPPEISLQSILRYCNAENSYN
jgi:hypothetical protein